MTLAAVRRHLGGAAFCFLTVLVASLSCPRGHAQQLPPYRDAKLPILVFNFKREGNIERAIAGHSIGTRVSE